MFVRDETKNLVNSYTSFLLGSTNSTYTQSSLLIGSFDVTITEPFDENIRLGNHICFDITLNDFSNYTQFRSIQILNLPKPQSSELDIKRCVLILHGSQWDTAIVNLNNINTITSDADSSIFTAFVVGDPISIESTSIMYIRIYAQTDWIVSSSS